EATPKIYDAVEEAFARHYPQYDIKVPSFMRYASWIGGDRDGNPNVTAKTTVRALTECRHAVIGWYIHQVRRLVTVLSVSANVVEIPEDFTKALAQALHRTGTAREIVARNPGEPLRQFAAAMLDRLRAMLGETAAKPYARSELFRNDLRHVETALAKLGGNHVARRFVRPLRQQVETFGFRTVALDIRQNSTVVNRVLAELFKHIDGDQAPTPDTPPWTKRIRTALSTGEQLIVEPQLLSDEARELLD
ncbi:phosphoenolpyruvate carboxylase, partial [Mesorhizobium sp. USDA-HM6]